MDSSSLIEKKIQDLRAVYVLHLTDRRHQLAKFLNTDKWDDKSREALISHAHKLVGSGKTYGFPDITTAADALEKELLAGDGNPKSRLQDLIDQIAIAEKQSPISIDFEDDLSQDVYKANDFPAVLVVDDDQDICRIIERVFQNQAKVFKALNAEAALEILKTLKPSLIFLDNKMPGIQGLEFLDIIKKDENLKDFPVIMLTASHEPADVMRGMAAGAIDYITKPFEPQKLLEKVSKHLELGQTLVMIADDDQPVLDILEYKFKNAGCKVITAQKGVDALKFMIEQRPDIAILDRMMPGGDGMSVFLRMQGHSRLSDIPVVFLTAKRYENDIRGALEAGVADYIVKPFSPDEVVVRCLRLLNKKR